MVYTTSERLSEPLREPDPRRASARLRIGSKTELVGSQGAVLGRSREADIRLDDPNVSRRHAEVRAEDGALWVVDLGSTNGIEVNGKRVKRAKLTDGDTITLGSTEVAFSQDSK